MIILVQFPAIKFEQSIIVIIVLAFAILAVQITIFHNMVTGIGFLKLLKKSCWYKTEKWYATDMW